MSDIRMILSRLGNTITNKDKKKIKKSFMKQKKSKTFQIRKRRDLWSSCWVSKNPRQKRKI